MEARFGNGGVCRRPLSDFAAAAAPVDPQPRPAAVWARRSTKPTATSASAPTNVASNLTAADFATGVPGSAAAPPWRNRLDPAAAAFPAAARRAANAGSTSVSKMPTRTLPQPLLQYAWFSRFVALGSRCVRRRFPPPLPSCHRNTGMPEFSIKECGVALAVHRNTSSTGLVMTSGAVTTSSSTDVFGFGYGHTMALMVRYDTRVRLFASYGCTIRVGYEEATLTGGQFFHGGVSVKPEADCGPGSYIDVIAEDWRLLSSGKKRLVFHHTCSTIPMCTDKSPPPPPPNTPASPPTTPTPRSPPSPNPPSPSPPPYAAHALEPALHTPSLRDSLRSPTFVFVRTGSHLGQFCRRFRRARPRRRRRRRPQASSRRRWSSGRRARRCWRWRSPDCARSAACSSISCSGSASRRRPPEPGSRRSPWPRLPTTARQASSRASPSTAQGLGVSKRAGRSASRF